MAERPDDWISAIWMRPDGTANIAFNRLAHDDAMAMLRFWVQLELARRNRNEKWPEFPDEAIANV